MRRKAAQSTNNLFKQSTLSHGDNSSRIGKESFYTLKEHYPSCMRTNQFGS